MPQVSESPSQRLFVSSDEMPDDVWQKNVFGRRRLANHLVPFYVYVPVVVIVTVYALSVAGVTPLAFLGAFTLAVPLWTVNEYVTHRFMFHYSAKSKFVRKLVYTMHTGHHEYPNDKRFMLIGLDVSVPNTIVTAAVFWLIAGQYSFGLIAGWLCSYLFYDWLHFATHVYNFEARWFRAYKKHHLQHHFKHNDKNFGVVTALWDYVVGTKLSRQGESSDEPVTLSHSPERGV